MEKPSVSIAFSILMLATTSAPKSGTLIGQSSQNSISLPTKQSTKFLFFADREVIRRFYARW